MQRVIDRTQLDEAVAAGRKVVLFRMTGCPFCRSFQPKFDAAVAGSAWTPVDAVLDDDDNPLWDDFQVKAVPAVLFFEDGRLVKRLDARLGAGLDDGKLREALRRDGGPDEVGRSGENLTLK